MLRVHPERKTYSADIKHRTFGRVHLALNTKVKTVAMTRHTALQQLLDTGAPVADLVTALRARKLTVEAVAECVRAKRPFDTLRPSTWPVLGDAVEQLVEAQEAKEKGSLNTARSSAVSLKHAVAHFGADRPLETISHDDVTAYKTYLREQGISDNTIYLYMIKFGALYTFLQKRETKRAAQSKRPPFVLFSPMDRDEHMPEQTKTRIRFLSEAEADRLLLATPSSYVAGVALGLFAGLRRGEVSMLRPQDVDIERSMLYVQARDGWTPKYRKNREIPISSALETYLAPHVETVGDAPYLFGGRGRGEPKGQRTLDDYMRRATTDAGFADGDVTFHTLRHTFASWLVMAGADLFTVARLLGHSNTTQVEQTYAHLSPGHKLATVEMLTTRWLNRSEMGSESGKTPLGTP